METPLRINTEDLDFDRGKQCLMHQGNPFSGVEIFTRADGTIEAERECSRGIVHGTYREWHQDGYISVVGEIEFGSHHGFVRHFDKHGVETLIEKFECGILVEKIEPRPDGSHQIVFSLEKGSSQHKILESLQSLRQKQIEWFSA